MKSKIFILALILTVLSLSGYTQQKITKTPVTPVFGVKDSLLCKQWKFVSYEEFSVANAPTEQQKNDGVTFLKDRTVFLTQDGKAKTGTWLTDENKTYINITIEDPKEMIKYKLMKVDDKHLTYEYQNEHLIRTILNFEPAAKK